MKDIYTFGRKPAKRNFTIKDLQDLKGNGQRLTMCNPANEVEIRACVDAGIDTLTVWDRDIDLARDLAPTHFIGCSSNFHNTYVPFLRAGASARRAGRTWRMSQSPDLGHQLVRRVPRRRRRTGPPLSRAPRLGSPS